MRKQNSGATNFYISLSKLVAMDFRNQTVWITGASSGIGEALAYAFAKEGARIILSARSVSDLERVREKCVGAAGLEIFPLDIGQFDQVREVGKQVISKVGQIDILVNNAGISQRALAKDTVFEVDKKIIDVNLLGTIAVTKAVLPSMLARKKGHIVTVSSMVGKYGTPLRSAYSASKHGLHGFFDALRAETYADNIRVLMVCPGFVRTSISINALTGDGSKQNKMDEATAGGLFPDAVAQSILKAIRGNKNEIHLAGSREMQGLYLSRFFPNLFAKFLRKAKVT